MTDYETVTADRDWEATDAYLAREDRRVGIVADFLRPLPPPCARCGCPANWHPYGGTGVCDRCGCDCPHLVRL